MDWVGKIIDVLGKPAIWIIGFAFLLIKLFGDHFGISITDKTILSVWNIVGSLCLIAMVIKIITLLYGYGGKKIENNKAKIHQEEAEIAKRNQRIDDLNSLRNQRIEILNSFSDDQKVLLQRFCAANQRTLHDFEIGGYQALWKPDMEVLIYKGVVKQINYSTFEIQSQYYDLIKEELQKNIDSQETNNEIKEKNP